MEKPFYFVVYFSNLVQKRNSDNKTSNFNFQFNKKNEMALWVHGLCKYILQNVDSTYSVYLNPCKSYILVTLMQCYDHNHGYETIYNY